MFVYLHASVGTLLLSCGYLLTYLIISLDCELIQDKGYD